MIELRAIATGLQRIYDPAPPALSDTPTVNPIPRQDNGFQSLLKSIKAENKLAAQS
jgi:hypothetical protein